MGQQNTSIKFRSLWKISLRIPEASRSELTKRNRLYGKKVNRHVTCSVSKRYIETLWHNTLFKLKEGMPNEKIRLYPRMLPVYARNAQWLTLSLVTFTWKAGATQEGSFICLTSAPSWEQTDSTLQRIAGPIQLVTEQLIIFQGTVQLYLLRQSQKVVLPVLQATASCAPLSLSNEVIGVQFLIVSTVNTYKKPKWLLRQ